MKVNDKVNHKKFGTGIIVKIFFEGTRRELFAIRFDVSNSELNDCLGLIEPYRGYFCTKKELEVI